jgi:hypothetical protein
METTNVSPVPQTVLPVPLKPVFVQIAIQLSQLVQPTTLANASLANT